MGTYTYYSLDWENGRTTCPTCGNNQAFDYVELLEQFMAKRKNEPDWDGFSDSWSWYDHEDDLKAFSLLHPGVLFILECKGDSWHGAEVVYAMDGRSYRQEGEMTFPKFDPRELE